MATSPEAFNQVRDILKKLDRSIDSARDRRLTEHGVGDDHEPAHRTPEHPAGVNGSAESRRQPESSAARQAEGASGDAGSGSQDTPGKARPLRARPLTARPFDPSDRWTSAGQ